MENKLNNETRPVRETRPIVRALALILALMVLGGSIFLIAAQGKPGRDAGSSILKKISFSEAPRTRAASISVGETDRTPWYVPVKAGKNPPRIKMKSMAILRLSK